MGYSRKDVEATKQMAKKFVRYQEYDPVVGSVDLGAFFNVPARKTL